MRTLTKDILIELGYETESWIADDGDECTIWFKNGITLHENRWSTNAEFNFAGRTRDDGSLKSGWSIKTDLQLKLLQLALTGK